MMDPDWQDDRDVASAETPAFPQERLLIDLLPEVEAKAVLCVTVGLAQLARDAAKRLPAATVHCHFLDLYHASRARQIATGAANLTIGCAADFPATESDLVALPVSASGEAELTRDFLQQGHERLTIGGQMIAATNNRDDRWLHDELRKIFDRVTRRTTETGAVYLSRKDRPLKKLKNFGCEFAFRDRGRLIHAFSRPGVFAHRRVDAGAHRLLDLVDIEPGERVIDIGCGSGVLSLAAALRAEGVTVHAVDSNARAIECAARGAVLNDIATISTELNATGDYEDSGTYQVALANPPYYANFRIARQFVLSARAALEPGGRIYLVTKLPDWYAENMDEWFDDVEIQENKSYYIVSGRNPD